MGVEMAQQKKEKKFEQAISELEEIVSKLEKSGLDLDEAILLYEKGKELGEFCKMKLDGYQKKISLLTSDGDGLIEQEYEIDEREDD